MTPEITQKLASELPPGIVQALIESDQNELLRQFVARKIGFPVAPFTVKPVDAIQVAAHLVACGRLHGFSEELTLKNIGRLSTTTPATPVRQNTPIPLQTRERTYRLNSHPRGAMVGRVVREVYLFEGDLEIIIPHSVLGTCYSAASSGPLYDWCSDSETARLCLVDHITGDNEYDDNDEPIRTESVEDYPDSWNFDEDEVQQLIREVFDDPEFTLED